MSRAIPKSWKHYSFTLRHRKGKPWSVKGFAPDLADALRGVMKDAGRVEVLKIVQSGSVLYVKPGYRGHH